MTSQSHLQPTCRPVDRSTGVIVATEALAGFPGIPGCTVEQVFARARRRGTGPALEAALEAAGLGAAPRAADRRPACRGAAQREREPRWPRAPRQRQTRAADLDNRQGETSSTSNSGTARTVVHWHHVPMARGAKSTPTAVSHVRFTQCPQVVRSAVPARVERLLQPGHVAAGQSASGNPDITRSRYCARSMSLAVTPPAL